MLPDPVQYPCHRHWLGKCLLFPALVSTHGHAGGAAARRTPREHKIPTVRSGEYAGKSLGLFFLEGPGHQVAHGLGRRFLLVEDLVHLLGDRQFEREFLAQGMDRLGGLDALGDHAHAA